jgi:hypothetical protein
MDSGTGCVGKGLCPRRDYQAASAFLLTYSVGQVMDSSKGRIGEGHARVETTKQDLHYSLPIG